MEHTHNLTTKASRLRFAICQPITAKWEGGWSNHPDDPGGPTMYGVIQKNYDRWRDENKLPRQSVRLITKPEALDYYFRWFWVPVATKYNLFPGVDLAAWDAGVNSGPGRAIRWLKAASGSSDHAETVKRLCAKRLSFVKGLRIFSTFGRGWSRRIADIEAKGVVMARQSMAQAKGARERFAEDLARESVEAERAEAKASEAKADTAAKTTGTGGVATGGAGTAASPQVPSEVAADVTLWVSLGTIAVSLLIAAMLVARAKHHADRARAYALEGRR